DWIDQFGFIRDPESKEGLPIGFTISRYRPQSGAPSPVPFVGFSCALCHSTLLRTSEGDAGQIHYGTGSISLNLFAWLDAFQAAMPEPESLPPGEHFDPAKPPRYRLTLRTIAGAYKTKTGRDLHVGERAMIALWVRQFRNRLTAGLMRFDEPFGH